MIGREVISIASCVNRSCSIRMIVILPRKLKFDDGFCVWYF